MSSKKCGGGRKKLRGSPRPGTLGFQPPGVTYSPHPPSVLWKWGVQPQPRSFLKICCAVSYVKQFFLRGRGYEDFRIFRNFWG